MKTESLLGHASELVRIIRKSPQPADVLASEYLRTRKYVGATDRRFITSIVYDVLRKLSLYEAMQEHLQLDDVVHAAHAIREGTVDVEQAWTDAIAEHRRCCTQEWLLEQTLRRWPDHAQQVWTAMMEAAPLCLRVNLRRASVADVLATLHTDGVEGVKGEHADAAIIIHDRVRLLQHPLYVQGIIEIQDEGSQLIGHACQVQAGMRVLDACAGAGGKALHLADVMKNDGRIVARDIEWQRLRQIAPRAKRAGVTCVHVSHVVRDAKPLTELFDVVLVDAPCSGMGTVRRMPMVKWRLTEHQAVRHARKQLNILTAHANNVAVGGSMVYATCSILPVENEDVVQAFLAEHPSYTLQQQCQVDPYHHGTDGLYWARMRHEE